METSGQNYKEYVNEHFETFRYEQYIDSPFQNENLRFWQEGSRFILFWKGIPQRTEYVFKNVPAGWNEWLQLGICWNMHKELAKNNNKDNLLFNNSHHTKRKCLQKPIAPMVQIQVYLTASGNMRIIPELADMKEEHSVQNTNMGRTKNEEQF